ncbi:UNVERIFIED_CONTAM: hypothetical protein Slati_3956500 [Sesamum latifolium]|uniref:Uncharacterized protein n=1 Tax=Sesamum latifolium TaxID=2727402 RepID=A0AAW2TS35_9LAMI
MSMARNNHGSTKARSRHPSSKLQKDCLQRRELSWEVSRVAATSLISFHSIMNAVASSSLLLLTFIAVFPQISHNLSE